MQRKVRSGSPNGRRHVKSDVRPSLSHTSGGRGATKRPSSSEEREGLGTAPRVGIVTALTDFSSAYSLSTVILEQAKMLGRNRYDYDLITPRCLPYEEVEYARREGIRLRRILPTTQLHDYEATEPPKDDTPEAPGFMAQVETYLNGDRRCSGLLNVIPDYDVLITHDLMFLSWFLPHNAAVRRCAGAFPGKHWLHWIHSAPRFDANVRFPSTLRCSAAPNSTYVFLNYSHRQAVANMLGLRPAEIAVVFNPRDPRDFFGFSEAACRLIEHYRLFDCDVLQVYPLSAPRWVHKGVRELLRLFSEWKSMGVAVKLVLALSHSGEPGDGHVEGISKYAQECGLVLDSEVILTPRYADEARMDSWRNCVPMNVIRDLTIMSNIFVFPSRSEACSLIQAEQSICGKFMVLNSRVPAMLEFAPASTLRYDFSSFDPDNDKRYYRCMAREIWSHLSHNSTFGASMLTRGRFYNRDWIWKQQFEPLLQRCYANGKEGARSLPAKEERMNSE